jgi:hypothetical protein
MPYHLGKNREDKMALHGLLFIINSSQGMHMKRVNFIFFLKVLNTSHVILRNLIKQRKT